MTRAAETLHYVLAASPSLVQPRVWVGVEVARWLEAGEPGGAETIHRLADVLEQRLAAERAGLVA